MSVPVDVDRDSDMILSAALTAAEVLLAEVHRLRETLAEFVDDEPCILDHHGYCQNHNLTKPCAVEAARRLLAAQPGTGRDSGADRG
jgi:hypothetical protein